MKKLKVLLFSILLMIPFAVKADGDISLSTSSLNINEGKTATFTIKATSAAGRVDISSSDNSVAAVSSTSEFLDNSVVTITVSAKKEGSATITVKLSDVATYDGNELGGTKSLNVSVKKTSTSSSTTKPSTSTTKPSSGSAAKPSGGSTASQATPVVEEKHIEITDFEIVGYDIDFDINNSEYTINVSPNVNKLYIIVSGQNYTVSGDKEVSIEGLSQIFVTFKNDTEEKMYTININREEVSGAVTPTKPEVEIKEVKNNTYLYTTIGFGLLSVILLVMLVLKSKKPKENKVPEIKEPTIIADNPVQSAPSNNSATTINNVIPPANNNPTPNNVASVASMPVQTQNIIAQSYPLGSTPIQNNQVSLSGVNNPAFSTSSNNVNNNQNSNI